MRDTIDAVLQFAIIEKAFSNWDKWATYSVAFRYMDEKKARLSDIQDIAARHGIAPSVINSRRREWVLYTKARAGDGAEHE